MKLQINARHGLLGLLLWSITGCSTSTSNIEVSILEDITDTLFAQPSCQDVFTVAQLDSTSLANIKVVCNTISDYEYNKSYSAELPEKSLLLSNPGERVKEIQDFKAQVAENISRINTGDNRRPQSNIYSVIVRESNRLAVSKAKRKICIVYSDLAENTSEFSIYRQADMALIDKQPKQVKQFFERKSKPGNLTGISLYIIYQAKSIKDNAMFARISEIYKQIFNSAGAEVYIGANVPSSE